MSGVFGVVDSRRQSNVERLLVAMGETMTHRDWYVVDTVADAPQGLGLGRIGIGIFNRERQPVCSEGGSLMVFLSGELYQLPDEKPCISRPPWGSRNSRCLE